MFDKVKIKVVSGKGGNGIHSFHREKFVPFGGPDGGDGGHGGDVIVRADSAMSNLLQYQHQKLLRAGDGGHGQKNKKHGKSGADLLVKVPVGTMVYEDASEEGGTPTLLADMVSPGQWVVIAGGGKGGRGNTHFASATNQAPRLSEKGGQAQEKDITLELKLIADVGIVGYPNAGKSSLLTASTAAHPKVAGYPFTTLEPVLGVAEVGVEVFVIAEVPGLIRDAHLGRGLGHDFLRHAVRTRVLIHLLDGLSEDPLADMAQVNRELSLFDPALAAKPQLVAVNKIDIPEVEAKTAEIGASLKSAGIKPLFVSAASGQGIKELLKETAALLKRLAETQPEKPEEVVKVFRPQPREPDIRVERRDGVFLVSAPQLERLVAGSDSADAETRRQLSAQFKRMGLSRALEKAGVVPGDKVRLGDFEWKW
jgi:GTP-binding protein